jgi:signal transduction histidine kinase
VPPDIFNPMNKRLFIVFISIMAVMSVYELAKQQLFPGITLWGSHLITIFFTSIIAVIIIYHPLRSLHLEHEKAVDEFEKRKNAEQSMKTANNKLTMLSSITRHDILNTLTVLIGYHELVREISPKDPALQKYLDKETECIDAIQEQIQFTKFYEEIGVQAAGWHDLHACIAKAAGQLALEKINLSVPAKDVEVFADPLIEKVCYNLMENSLRHGGPVSMMKVRWAETEGDLVITYEDDGRGIPARDKEKIFTRGYGKHTGLGMFLIREILSITGITIIENGTESQGVRFVITVPKSGYRYTGEIGSPQRVLSDFTRATDSTPANDKTG